jgi:hypothetical protein
MTCTKQDKGIPIFRKYRSGLDFGKLFNPSAIESYAKSLPFDILSRDHFGAVFPRSLLQR